MLFGKKTDRPNASATAATGPPVTSAPASKIETIIGPNAHFKGDVQSDGGLRIDGIFEGNIDIAGNLVIGESAKVIADIAANNVSISGAVKGDVNGNRVEILETGRVWGDLTITSLLLNEGAYLRGQTTMHGDIEPPMIEAPKPQPSAAKSERISSVAESSSAKIVDVEPKPKLGEKDESQEDGEKDEE